mgnify:CR=1 FL=1
MKKLLLLVFIPLLSLSQKNHLSDYHYNLPTQEMFGCQDLDETILDLVSVFADISTLGFIGCSDIIPTLESNILSALLPFDIPLDCNTDISPFGYLDMNVSDICECSCEDYLNLDDPVFYKKTLIQNLSILGQQGIASLQLYIYNDGSVEKRYIIKR